MKLSLKILILMFDFFVPFVIVLWFFIYCYNKNKKFFESFFYGVLAYCFKAFFFQRLLDKILVFKEDAVFSMPFNLDFFICFLYFLLMAAYTVFVRVFFFKLFFKQEDWDFNAISFAVGFCTIYNIKECAALILMKIDNFLNFSFAVLLSEGFNSFLVIVVDAVFTLLISYFLKKRTKFKLFFLIILAIFDSMTMFFSVQIRSLFLREVFSVGLCLFYFFVLILLRNFIKKEKNYSK